MSKETCKDVLNRYFIECKGYDPVNAFTPSNESMFIWNHQQEKLDALEFKGACPTCEPVGELNEKLQAANKILSDAVGFYSNKMMEFRPVSGIESCNLDYCTDHGKLARKAKQKAEEVMNG